MLGIKLEIWNFLIKLEPSSKFPQCGGTKNKRFEGVIYPLKPFQILSYSLYKTFKQENLNPHPLPLYSPLSSFPIQI